MSWEGRIGIDGVFQRPEIRGDVGEHRGHATEPHAFCG